MTSQEVNLVVWRSTEWELPTKHNMSDYQPGNRVVMISEGSETINIKYSNCNLRAPTLTECCFY